LRTEIRPDVCHRSIRIHGATFQVKATEENVMTGRAVLLGVSTAALLLAANSAREARAQGRGMGGGMISSPVVFLRVESVQKELGLKPEQVEKAKDLAKDASDELTEERNAAGMTREALQDLSPEERAKKMAEFQTKSAEIAKKINSRFMPKVEELLDKGQLKRLKEIAIQAQGPGALHDPDVAKALSITDEQQEKIKKIGKEFGDRMREAFTSGGDRDEIRAKTTQLREEQTAKTMEVLTKEQQAKFADMKGKPFDTRGLFGGGRRRRAQ
jgi:Spy/CpxP family protein refolding chaperone